MCCVPSQETNSCNDMVDNDCDGTVDCVDADCHPTLCGGGTQGGQPCSSDATIEACHQGGGVCQCPLIVRDPTTITFRRPSARFDRLRSHGRVMIPGPVDVMGSKAGWLVSNDKGPIFEAVLPPGAMRSNNGGTYFKYKNLDAKSQGGVYRAIIIIKGGSFYAFNVEAYGDMSAATASNMTIQFYVGDLATSAIHGESWRRMKNGWKADDLN